MVVQIILTAIFYIAIFAIILLFFGVYRLSRMQQSLLTQMLTTLLTMSTNATKTLTETNELLRVTEKTIIALDETLKGQHVEH